MTEVTLRQLRAVLETRRGGKIGNAAKALGLTQPAVTLQIRSLEQAFGTPLFDRTRSGMRPTAAGETVIAAATEIEERLRQLASELDAIRGVRSGALRLGVVSTAKYFAPSIMAEFMRLHPHLELTLLVGNRDETIARLNDFSIDIALMGRPRRDFPVRASAFGEHPLVIIANPAHPLATTRRISKERIARERLLVRESGSGTRTSQEFFFADVPNRPDPIGIEMGSNETIKQAVIAGLGIAFISAHTIAQEVELGRLVVLDVEGIPIRRQWFAVSRADRTSSPAMLAFEAFLAENGARFLPDLPRRV